MEMETGLGIVGLILYLVALMLRYRIKAPERKNLYLMLPHSVFKWPAIIITLFFMGIIFFGYWYGYCMLWLFTLSIIDSALYLRH